jgi:hypothetical protein
LTAQLGNLFDETYPRKAGGDPGAKGCPGTAILLHCVAEDLTHLFLRAATVTPRTSLELGLDIVVELSDQELGHGGMIARYRGAPATVA